jgi:WhiB family redox-sensing transcriptional regulator
MSRTVPSPARLEVEVLEDGEFNGGHPTGLDNDWMRSAACLDHEPEVFFPPGPGAMDQIDEAKAVCRACPVVTDCLRVALTDPTLVGVWGGTSEAERAELIRSRRRASASSAAAG